MQKVERLEFEIDLRMRTIWGEITNADFGEKEELVAALVRAGYGLGYYDALRERVRGQLCLDTGYGIPERRSA